MPTKIKLFLSFLVVIISIFLFRKHYISEEFLRSSLIILIGCIMNLGLWILPEAKGKVEEANEKK